MEKKEITILVQPYASTFFLRGLLSNILVIYIYMPNSLQSLPSSGAPTGSTLFNVGLALRRNGLGDDEITPESCEITPRIMDIS